MSKIRVDIDELCSILDDIKEDDYVTIELDVIEDGYYKEIEVYAVSLEEDEPISYGTVCEAYDELL